MLLIIRIYLVFYALLLELAYKDMLIEEEIYVDTKEPKYKVKKILDLMLDNNRKVKYLIK